MIKVKQPALSLSQQEDCKTRKDTKYCLTKQGPTHKKPQTTEANINNDSTTEALSKPISVVIKSGSILSSEFFFE